MRFFGPHDVPWCPPRLTNLSAAPFLFGPAAPFPFRARWPREAPWTKDRRAWSGSRPAHQSVVVYLLITPYIARYIYYYLLNIYYMSWLVDVRWFFFNCITESGVKWSLLISSVHELRQEVAGKLFVSAHLRRVRRDFGASDVTRHSRIGPDEGEFGIQMQESEEHFIYNCFSSTTVIEQRNKNNHNHNDDRHHHTTTNTTMSTLIPTWGSGR